MKKIATVVFLGFLFVSYGTTYADEAAGPLEKFAAKQVDQLQAGCKTELETYCKTVTPGKGRVAACIYAYGDKISTKCERALYDSTQEFEVAALMLNAFAAACKADIEKLCPAVMVGEGRILACLEQHKAQVSDQCNKARANADRGLNAQETAV